MLEVVGKVVARALQKRLKQIAHCGLIICKGRGCTDMMFIVRVEHQTKQFPIFANLACNLVPHTV